jgi:hypothetical protein
MDKRDLPEAAREMARTARLLQEARELQSRYTYRNSEDLISGSRRRLALSRALLAKPVQHPFTEPDPKPARNRPPGWMRQG